jgi:hypothetical protein
MSSRIGGKMDTVEWAGLPVPLPILLPILLLIPLLIPRNSNANSFATHFSAANHRDNKGLQLLC